MDNLDKSKAETNNTITLRTMNRSQDNYKLTIDNLTSDNNDVNDISQNERNKQNIGFNYYKENRECNIKLSEDFNIDFDNVD